MNVTSFDSPHAIREALLPEEVDDFDRQYRAALATAAGTFDLAEVDALLDHWRMIARLSQDVDGHRRMLRKAAALEANGPLGSQPWESFRLRHGLQMYRVEIDPDVAEQIAALPADALSGYAEVLSVLELVPWNGQPYHRDKPDGRMRVITFADDGRGLVVYLVFDEPPVVSLLLVAWIE